MVFVKHWLGPRYICLPIVQGPQETRPAVLTIVTKQQRLFNALERFTLLIQQLPPRTKNREDSRLRD
jgi:hypothetical protein